MQQVFHISADEEVNSIISRIKKTRENFIVLTIPQRALVLQSMVSLKLIKREADKINKKVVIVTQDVSGVSLANKVGFLVRTSLENIEGGIQKESMVPSIRNSSKQSFTERESSQEEKASIPSRSVSGISMEKRQRLNGLGSKDFNEKSLSKTSRLDPVSDQEKFVRGSSSEQMNISFTERQEEEFNDLFVNSQNSRSFENDRNVLSNKMSSFFWLFAISAIVIICFVVGYLFLPKAQIDVYPQEESKNVELNLLGAVEKKDIGFADTVDVKLIRVEKEYSLSKKFSSTGEKESSNKKARGKILIYNEFSEASQGLVATTRFLSEEGKLFRLVSSVTVPGMTKKEGKVEPGVIEAEVIADESGKDYNIGSGDFTIPGFKGSSKYDKFYAKSKKDMSGGGDGDSSVKVVSKEDIKLAKEDVLKEVKRQAVDDIKAELASGVILLDDAISYSVIDSVAFPDKGSVSDDFEYQIKVKMVALTFSEEELNRKIISYVKENFSNEDYYEKILVQTLSYKDINIDFDDSTLNAIVDAEIFFEASINKDMVKKELLGASQVDDFINNHPEVKKIEATITPNFVSNKIPKYENRVTVDIVED